MSAPLNSSLATIRLGGREYPAAGSQRCRTCSHPERDVIERHLVRGWSPATISASLPPDRALTARQIGDHLRAHLPVQDEGVQRYRERAAEERGDVVAEGAEQVVTALEFARRVMVTVATGLASGDLVPKVNDGLKAAQLLAATDQDDQDGYSKETVTTAFMVYLAGIRATCTPDQVRGIGEAVSSDPLMRDLFARRDRDPSGAEG